MEAAPANISITIIVTARAINVTPFIFLSFITKTKANEARYRNMAGQIKEIISIKISEMKAEALENNTSFTFEEQPIFHNKTPPLFFLNFFLNLF